MPRSRRRSARAAGMSCGRRRRRRSARTVGRVRPVQDEDADAGRRLDRSRAMKPRPRRRRSRAGGDRRRRRRGRDRRRGRTALVGVPPALPTTRQRPTDAAAGRRGSRGPIVGIDEEDPKREPAAAARDRSCSRVSARPTPMPVIDARVRIGLRHSADGRCVSRAGNGSRAAAGRRGAAPASIASSGRTTTSIVVPSPGRESTSSVAPIFSARARIPARPRWPSGTAAASKPLPSSRDPEHGRPPRAGRSTARPGGRAACLTTLWSASWAIR